MTGASTGVYELYSVVRGHHIYKIVWTPLVNETLLVHGAGKYQQTQQMYCK